MNAPASGASVGWYVQTAGAATDQGYRWIALEPGGQPSTGSRVLQGSIARRPLVNLLSDSSQSIVLGRLDDGVGFLLVRGLRPAAAPAGGDYMHRPIRVTVVGVAPDGADPAPLLAAAAAALDGSLADTLPLAWTDDGPTVVASDLPWNPTPRAAAAPSGAVPDIRESAAVPDTDDDRKRVAAELAAVDPGHFGSLPAGRPLLLATSMADRQDLDALNPWRAVTTTVTRRTPLSAKEWRSRHPSPWYRIAVFLAVLALLTLAAWFALTGVGRG